MESFPHPYIAMICSCFNLACLRWFFRRSVKFYMGLLSLQLPSSPLNSRSVFKENVNYLSTSAPSVTHKVQTLHQVTLQLVIFTLCFQGFVMRSGWIEQKHPVLVVSDGMQFSLVLSILTTKNPNSFFVDDCVLCRHLWSE